MQRREEDRNLARRIKYTEGKFRKPGNTLVNQQQNNISTLEITDKILLEKVILAENLKKYHHTKGDCPLLDNPRFT